MSLVVGRSRSGGRAYPIKYDENQRLNWRGFAVLTLKKFSRFSPSKLMIAVTNRVGNYVFTGCLEASQALISDSTHPTDPVPRLRCLGKVGS